MRGSLGALLVAASLFSAAAYFGTCNVTTYAGSGAYGVVDGIGTAAQLAGPGQLALHAASGRLFWPDIGMGAIRVLHSSNMSVRTVVMTGMLAPEGIAVAADGSQLFVAVWTNNNIVRVALPGGVTSLLAGSAAGNAGFADATGTSAAFSNPVAAALTASGSSLLVADYANNRIRSVDIASRAVTTLAGDGSAATLDGQGTSARLRGPTSLALAPDGFVYVTEYSGNTIRRISPSGYVSTVAGTGVAGAVDGPAAAAQFYGPYGIAVRADGDIVVSDASGNRIRGISGGVVVTLAGTGSAGATDGPGAAATFYAPEGVVFMPDGSIAVADRYSNKLRRLVCGCPPGFYCTGASVRPCPPGRFCPAGTVSMASAPACGMGNYCPEGSAAPLPCPLVMGPNGPPNGPAFSVDTAMCLKHCYSGGPGQLSSCD